MKVELNVDVEFTGERVEGFNVLAEIPGVDDRHKNEVVMVTAHLDSWAAGTGATDDGAGRRDRDGSDAHPQCASRSAGANDQGRAVDGRRAGPARFGLTYVRRHIADAPRAATPDQSADTGGDAAAGSALVVPKPDHARLSAVFNVDLGGGQDSRHGLSGNLRWCRSFSSGWRRCGISA